MAMSGPFEDEDVYGDEKYTVQRWMYDKKMTSLVPPHVGGPPGQPNKLHETKARQVFGEGPNLEPDDSPTIGGFRKSTQSLISDKW